MPASLPPRPSLEWLRKAARKRLAALRQIDPDARLADAQLDVAREYGFSSWRALKAHVDQSRANVDAGTGALFLRRVAAGDLDSVRAMLDASPELIHLRAPHPYWGGKPQALHVAIESGRRAMFDLILERGADVNGLNDEYDHWSPLMLAADRPGMRDVLLERGARVGLAEALLLADDRQVDAIISRDGLPTIVPNDGSILAFVRTTYAIDRLLDAGALIDARDHWGKSPVEVMSGLGQRGVELVEHMIARGAAVKASDYARIGDLAALERIAAKQGNSAVTADDVMMAAVNGRHVDLVRWLLARGAKANARDDSPARATALHAAAWGGDMAMVRLLVDAGAAIEARDDEHDSTPHGWALTSIDVTKNSACADVAAFLENLSRTR